MKNFLFHKTKHTLNYADSVYRKFREIRYGISSCKAELESDLAFMRKELTNWQSYDDAGALTTSNLQYQTWLPVEYDHNVYLNGGTGYYMTNENIGPQRLAVKYEVHGAVDTNVIQVNANGAVTRINLSPAITVNNNMSYVYTQTVPSLVWTVEHKMGFRPNVFTEDATGADIEGLVEYVDTNILKITFNTPVAGKAYLS
jgi:hypothetical protein